MKENISFLIGSGFSQPEGIPMVNELNERLKAINQEEILIHTNLSAFFLKGQKDPNRWSHAVDRYFVQEFLKYYNEAILGSEKYFHYEDFYDFYSRYLNDKENELEIEKFYDQFKKQFNENTSFIDTHNAVASFDRTFSQLLAGELTKPKYYSDVSLSNYPIYDSFATLVKGLIETQKVKIHSLNHDILLDWLGRHHSLLWENFSDGYNLVGSQYYGKLFREIEREEYNIHKEYLVKLRYFTGDYSKSISLHKLHGSIDTIIALDPDGKQPVRVKKDYGIGQYFFEKNNSKLVPLWDEPAPDFLTGTTTKIRFYDNDNHYRIQFDHFRENLTNSDFLVSIGYGFNDSGINEIIENKFLKQGGKIIIIEPRNEFEHPFQDHYKQCIVLPFGIEKLPVDLIKKYLESND